MTAFRCPTRLQVFRQLLLLLPPGKAWQSLDAPGQAYTVTMAQPGFAQPGLFQTLDRPLTVMHAFWSATADFFYQLTALLCALRLEFFCATQSQTRDLWLAEYGLPDACDPNPDICAKAAATGGTRCEYFAEVALRAGWSIDCRNFSSTLCAMFGAYRFAEIGLGGVGGVATIEITVHLNDSPAFQRGTQAQPFFGAMQFGNTLNCAADISSLVCLLDRIVPAHVAVIYVTSED